MTTISPPPVLLIAGANEHFFTRALDDFGFVVVRTPTSAMSMELARAVKPDLILVGRDSLDLPGLEFCFRLRHDVEIPAESPILLVLDAPPSPELRVAGLRAGVWDYVCRCDPVEEVNLKIEMHVQARRNVQAAAVDGLVNRASGVLTRDGLTQRLREIGALMVRMRGRLACIAFEFAGGPADGTEATLIARSARSSDTVGALSRSEVVVLAPDTDDCGAVNFARRMAAGLRLASGRHPTLVGVTVHAGYAAVSNMKYAPLNPIDLLSRATLAITAGTPDREHPWIRGLPPAAIPGRGINDAPRGAGAPNRAEHPPIAPVTADAGGREPVR
jgi:DNA-binding response OmpR family regulator